MSRGEPTAAEAPSAADRERYAAALPVAADQELVFGPVLTSFERLRTAVCAGDHVTGALAVRDLELHCLQFCVVPAGSAAAADDRRPMFAIIAGWAWPRRPALAAVLDRNAAQETRRWGGDVAGEA